LAASLILNNGRSPVTFSSNPIFCTVVTLSILTYLGAIIYLTTYLRRVYTTTWVDLGGFTLWDVLWDARRRHLNGLIEWYVAGFRTLGFVLFSNQYRAVRDRKLTFLIWLVRASLDLSLALMLVVMTSSLIQLRP
jgi:hypothetical protein